MRKRLLTVTVLMTAGTGCGAPSQEEEARDLYTRSLAIEDRAASAADAMGSLAREVSAWREANEIEASPAEILASLLADPYLAHAPREQEEPLAEAYASLETRAASLRAERRDMALDWEALTADVDEWAERFSVAFEEFSIENRFAVGRLPGDPDIALAKRPCPLSVINAAGRTCHLVEEHCISLGRQGGVLLWSQVCRYRCSRTLNPFDDESTIARLANPTGSAG